MFHDEKQKMEKVGKYLLAYAGNFVLENENVLELDLKNTTASTDSMKKVYENFLREAGLASLNGKEVCSDIFKKTKFV